MTDEVWRPTPEQIADANVTRLMHTHGIDSFDELVRRSIEDPEWFWPAVVADLDIEFSTPFASVIDAPAVPSGRRGSSAVASTSRDSASTGGPNGRPDAVAVVWEGEDGDVRAVTYAELRDSPTAARVRCAGSGSARATGSRCSCRWRSRPWPR